MRKIKNVLTYQERPLPSVFPCKRPVKPQHGHPPILKRGIKIKGPPQIFATKNEMAPALRTQNEMATPPRTTTGEFLRRHTTAVISASPTRKTKRI
jgi:hypothetical protein